MKVIVIFKKEFYQQTLPTCSKLLAFYEVFLQTGGGTRFWASSLAFYKARYPL